ncbi:MAG: hypothetical protein E6Q97_31265 [Desulfurellales bacterium]|nr:MAG: hypothetical protein E6Q97_31265 [Desulfurellales bacterium]
MSSNNGRERGDRVKLGHVRRLQTKAGNDWFVGNLGQATKIVILPARRKGDDGEWETVEGQFDVFLEAKTADEIAKDKEYWENRRGNVSNSKPAASGGGLKPLSEAPKDKPAAGQSWRDKSGGLNDEIPFSLLPVALAASAVVGLVCGHLAGIV